CLPSHMKRKICDCLATVDLDGLLCLILAVPHLAADGRATLSRVMSWAGKRIITLGKYADDVPENLLTEEEDEELYINFPEKNYVINEHSFVLLLGEATSEFYPKTHRFLEARHMTARLRTDDSSWLHFSLKCLIRPPIIQPTDAVLRNLTLKQYYRSSGYCPGGWCERSQERRSGTGACLDNDLDHDETNGYCKGLGSGRGCGCGCKCGRIENGKDNVNFSLGQVVLIMTCWSKDPSTSFDAEWTEKDVQGEWAGHLLDIVAPDKVPADWEDVTETVKAKLIRLRHQPQPWGTNAW
ncbi:hypothetical protein IWQ57_004971, partial [Coemansia nantahalensis]